MSCQRLHSSAPRNATAAARANAIQKNAAIYLIPLIASTSPACTNARTSAPNCKTRLNTITRPPKKSSFQKSSLKRVQPPVRVVLALVHRKDAHPYKDRIIANVSLANQITPAEAVALTYKVIYAFYSCILALGFLYQGLLEISLIRDVTAGGTQDAKRLQRIRTLVVTFVVTTILATGGLLVQAATAIYSIVGVISTVGKLVIILTCELFPTFALAFLFRSTTIFPRLKSRVQTLTGMSSATSPESSSAHRNSHTNPTGSSGAVSSN